MPILPTAVERPYVYDSEQFANFYIYLGITRKEWETHTIWGNFYTDLHAKYFVLQVEIK